MATTGTKSIKESALTKALENSKGSGRPTLYKGFYIYADQYVKLVELSAYNKIHGKCPSTSSEIIRFALDEYLAKR
jgi:hypothetical protein